MIISKDYKKIIQNVFYLSLINIINYVLPLILIPYLLHRFGLELFGKYVTTQAIIALGIMVVNFGFDFSAVKLASINRNNIKFLKLLIRNVTLSKLLLFVIITIVFALIALTGTIDRDVVELTTTSLLYILFFAMIPSWFYQGVEEMKYITFVTILQKTLFFLACFVWINGTDDFLKVGIFLVLSSLIALITSYFTLKCFFSSHQTSGSTNLNSTEKIDVKTLLKQSYHLFLSTFFMSAYREVNVLLIKFFVSFEIVAIYSVAEKIIKGMQGVISPITRALFPYFSIRMLEDEGKNKFEKFLVVYAIGLIITVIIFNFSVGIVANLFISDEQIKNYELLVCFLHIMSLVIFVGGLNYTLGIIGLVNLGKEKLFTSAVIISGVFSLVLVFGLALLIPNLSGPFAFLGAELLLLLLLLNFYFRGK